MYAKYSSDLEYFFSFQFGHIFMRYFLWNFVGRAGDMQDAPVALAGVEGDWSESSGYPNRYYAIPLMLGLIGMLYHFRKDVRTGVAMGALFFIMGFGLVIYFNMVEPQVRERDYFFIGAFYVFALWTGIGVYGLIDTLRERAKLSEAVGVVLALVLLVAGPGNMLAQNFQTHDRHHNYVAFDYAYNLLQSCEQDAILFTGGDNDTFPVWFLQYAAGFRRDVRVINLSLVNTDWYILQMKNETPYGAKKVKSSYSDEEIHGMRPVMWETKTIDIPLDPARIDLRSLQGVPGIAGRPVPSAMSLTIAPTYSDPAGTKGLRTQDLMILDILQNNINDRPIYFALSTAPSDRLALDKYLVVEGMAYRVTPFEQQQQRMDRYYPADQRPRHPPPPHRAAHRAREGTRLRLHVPRPEPSGREPRRGQHQDDLQLPRAVHGPGAGDVPGRRRLRRREAADEEDGGVIPTRCTSSTKRCRPTWRACPSSWATPRPSSRA